MSAATDPSPTPSRANAEAARSESVCNSANVTGSRPAKTSASRSPNRSAAPAIDSGSNYVSGSESIRMALPRMIL